MTNAQGALVWDALYRPFGEEHSIVGAAVNRQRFPGQYHDAETGFHQNWHRDYDPRTGRYLQSDPIGLAGGINTYAYVGGNPVNLTDREGLFVPALVSGVRFCLGNPTCGRAAATAAALAAMWWKTTCDRLLPRGAPVMSSGEGGAGSGAPKMPQPQTGMRPAPPSPPIPDDPTTSPGPDWEWRGRGPEGSRQGAWHNPNTGESLHPDLGHAPPIGPHWDWKDSSGGRWRVYPDGKVEPKP